MKPHKVFGIGFHKTGTTSLAAALDELGYSVTGPNGVNREDIAQCAWRMCKRLIAQYDAFQDNPWPLFFKEVHEYLPDSKFILTIRSGESWLKSTRGFFGSKTTPMRDWIYGAASPVGNEDRYLERYERHNREVLVFFADKPASLLVMDFAAGDGWERLCPFLGESPVPDRPFPHKNAHSYAKQNAA